MSTTDPYQGLFVVIGVNAGQGQGQQREEMGLSLRETMDVSQEGPPHNSHTLQCGKQLVGLC